MVPGAMAVPAPPQTPRRSAVSANLEELQRRQQHIKSQLAAAIAKLDRNRLRTVLAKASQAGLTEDATMREARRLAYTVDDDEFLELQIAKALEDRDASSLDALTDAAELKGLRSPLIQRARKVLLSGGFDAMAADPYHQAAGYGAGGAGGAGAAGMLPRRSVGIDQSAEAFSRAAQLRTRKVLRQQGQREGTSDFTEVFAKLTDRYPLAAYSHLRKASNYAKRTYRAKKDLVRKMNVFQTEPIPRSLFKLSTEYCGGAGRSQAIKHAARDLFKNILCYQKERYHAYPVTLAHELIVRGWEELLLRDAIYCHLIKQTSEVPADHAEAELLGWKLIYLCLSSFPPGDEMSMVLLSHIAAAANPCPDRFAGFSTVADTAAKCYEVWKQTTSAGPRDKPPSIEEIQALTESKPIPLKLRTQDGSYIKVEIPPQSRDMVMDDLADEVARLLHLHEDERHMFEIQVQCEIRTLHTVDYVSVPGERSVFGVISHWEQQSKQHPDTRYTLTFRKRIWRDVDQSPVAQSQGYVKLVYYSIVQAVAERQIDVPLRQLGLLAALNYIIFSQGQTIMFDDVTPQRLAACLPTYAQERGKYEEWREEMVRAGAEATEHLANPAPVRELMLLYLQAVAERPMFGRMIFNGRVHCPVTPDFAGKDIRLAVNFLGILVTDVSFRSIGAIPFDSITNLEFNAADKIVSFTATDTASNKNRDWQFQSQNATGLFDVLCVFIYDSIPDDLLVPQLNQQQTPGGELTPGEGGADDAAGAGAPLPPGFNVGGSVTNDHSSGFARQTSYAQL